MLAHYSVGELMQEVLSAVSDLLMNTSQPFPGLQTVLGSLLFTADPSLSAFELGLLFSVEPGRSHLFTRRESNKRLQAHVQTHRVFTGERGFHDLFVGD